MSVALITGGSAGLGLALLEALAEQGWTVITDGRDADRLADGPSARVVARGRSTSPTRPTGRPWSPRSNDSVGWTCWCTTPARWGRCRCGRCAS